MESRVMSEVDDDFDVRSVTSSVPDTEKERKVSKALAYVGGEQKDERGTVSKLAKRSAHAWDRALQMNGMNGQEAETRFLVLKHSTEDIPEDWPTRVPRVIVSLPASPRLREARRSDPGVRTGAATMYVSVAALRAQQEMEIQRRMAGPPQPVRRRRRKTLAIGDKLTEENLERRQSESLSSSLSSTDASDNMSDFDVHLDHGSEADKELDAMVSGLDGAAYGAGGDTKGRPRRRSLLKRAQDELLSAITGWLDEPSVTTEMCSLDIFEILPKIPTGKTSSAKSPKKSSCGPVSAETAIRRAELRAWSILPRVAIVDTVLPDPDLDPDGWISHKGPNGREFWHHLSMGPAPWQAEEVDEFAGMVPCTSTALSSTRSASLMSPEESMEGWISFTGADGRTFWHHEDLGPAPWTSPEWQGRNAGA